MFHFFAGLHLSAGGGGGWDNPLQKLADLCTTSQNGPGVSLTPL